jgi:hypothetical protein
LLEAQSMQRGGLFMENREISTLHRPLRPSVAITIASPMSAGATEGFWQRYISIVNRRLQEPLDIGYTVP